MKKLLPIAAAVFGLIAASNASALTITYNYGGAADDDAAFNASGNGLGSGSYVLHAGATDGPGYALRSTAYSTLLSLPKFNLAGYHLTGATIGFGGGFEANGEIDSQDALAVPVFTADATVAQKFFANGSNGSTNITFVGQQLDGSTNAGRGLLNLSDNLFSGALAATDEGIGNPADFAGLDWTGPISASAEDWWNVKTVAAAGLAALSGAGNFLIYNDVTTGLNLSGTLNVTADILTLAHSKIQVTYTYEPDTQLPEPATLSLFGLGLAGIAAARRRKA